MATNNILFPDPQHPVTYGFLSSSPHAFRLGGKCWPSAENYLIAMRFEGTGVETRIRRCQDLKAAYQLFRLYETDVRPDWPHVEMRLTRRALFAKFQAHLEIRAALLATGHATLIQQKPGYSVPHGSCSHNALGIALTRTRKVLRWLDARQQ